MKKNMTVVISIKGTLGLGLILWLMLWIAGRNDYWQAWVFTIANIVVTLFLFILFKDKSELAEERMHPGPGVKWWDWILLSSFGLAIFASIIVGAFDTGKYMWTQQQSITFYITAYLLYFISIVLFTWPMFINKWFSSMVRIQKDRKQKVVSTGPYKYVRHPGYVGGIIMSISMAMMLGSYYALIPGIAGAVIMIIRTYLEDITLQKELKGYKEYCKKTKYRLVPGIW